MAKYPLVGFRIHLCPCSFLALKWFRSYLLDTDSKATRYPAVNRPTQIALPDLGSKPVRNKGDLFAVVLSCRVCQTGSKLPDLVNIRTSIACVIFLPECRLLWTEVPLEVKHHHFHFCLEL